MKLPWVSRQVHEQICVTLKFLLESKNQLIQELVSKNLDKDKQIQALLAQMTDPKCNALHSAGRKVAQNSEIMTQGRGGWRQRSKFLSDNTIPKEKDSVSALEDRVAAEGGTV